MDFFWRVFEKTKTVLSTIFFSRSSKKDAASIAHATYFIQ
jgi:hypothetical protein